MSRCLSLAACPLSVCADSLIVGVDFHREIRCRRRKPHQGITWMRFISGGFLQTAQTWASAGVCHLAFGQWHLQHNVVEYVARFGKCTVKRVVKSI